MKQNSRSTQHHDLYRKYHGQDSKISGLLGKCGNTSFKSNSISVRPAAMCIQQTQRFEATHHFQRTMCVPTRSHRSHPPTKSRRLTPSSTSGRRDASTTQLPWKPDSEPPNIPPATRWPLGPALPPPCLRSCQCPSPIHPSRQSANQCPQQAPLRLSLSSRTSPKGCPCGCSQTLTIP